MSKEEQDLNNAQNPKLGYDALLTLVLPKWDCDDCKYYPCTHQYMMKNNNAKLRYNTCGDHSERGTP